MDIVETLWHEYSSEERKLVLELLYRFDLLMGMPNESNESVCGNEIIAVPALLPSTANGVRWARKEGGCMLMVWREFLDVFLLGTVGIVTVHLHRMVGGQRTAADFVKSMAILLSVDGPIDGEQGKVMMESDRKHRRIVGTVTSLRQTVLTHMLGCVKAFEECLGDSLRRMRIRRKHYLVFDCGQELSGCGKKGSVKFELEQKWIIREKKTQLPN